jgi:SAM-dependent methyltransferase
MTSTQDTSLYDQHYYATSCGLPYERSDHWINFFGQVADHLIRALRPSRVFDAGCALGFLVESFWDRGVVCEGVDVSEYAISQVRKDIAPYCRVQSLTEPVGDRFDLVTCIEVLEHIPAGHADQVIANLCGAADTILFSSTPSDFSEPTHVNVRPSKYWLDLFAKYGFGPDPYFDAGFLTPHAFLLRKGVNVEEAVLRLFSEHLRLKATLQSTAVALSDARTAQHIVQIEAFAFTESAAPPTSSIVKPITVNSWQTATFTFHVPGITRLRLDPGSEFSVIEIQSMTVRNALSGTVIWAAHTPAEFELLLLQGTATRLKAPSVGLMLLSYGGDPQVVLPPFDASSTDPIIVEVTLLIYTDKDGVAARIAAHLQAEAHFQGSIRGQQDVINDLQTEITRLRNECAAWRESQEVVDEKAESAALREAQQFADQLQTEIATVRNECAALRGAQQLADQLLTEVATVRNECAALRQSADKADRDLKRKIEELDEARDALRSLSDNAAKSRYELNTVRQHINELERGENKSRALLEQQLAACRTTLDGVLISASWKVTKPLRDIMAVLRGGRR